MQTSNRFFDDLAKMAGGAASALVGIKQELDAMVRQQLERAVASLDLVTRDEFEAVRALATNARAAQESLEQRVAALEARLGATGGEAAAKPAADDLAGGTDATSSPG
ncbi:MAG: accessory factor UbiK family protein [Defluviicoccus sp.]|nr:accessory factor UbiK family protein [Defluviicoccus sp.]MDS4071916.1 accessory factor UbiK family protein [Defluviicoccus sp.]